MSPVRRNPDVVSTRLEDETVLLHPATRALFTLNATGQVVWEALDDGLEAVVCAVVQRFDVTEDEARRDALELIDELRASDLVSDG